MSDKGYRMSKNKKAIYLWKEDLNLLEVFNSVWDKGYIYFNREGDLELDIAMDHEGIEDYIGKALLPTVYVDKNCSGAFKEKVTKFVRTWGHYSCCLYFVKIVK